MYRLILEYLLGKYIRSALIKKVLEKVKAYLYLQFLLRFWVDVLLLIDVNEWRSYKCSDEGTYTQHIRNSSYSFTSIRLRKMNKKSQCKRIFKIYSILYIAEICRDVSKNHAITRLMFICNLKKKTAQLNFLTFFAKFINFLQVNFKYKKIFVVERTSV